MRNRREFLGAVAAGAGAALPLAGEMSEALAAGPRKAAPRASAKPVRRGRAIAAGSRGHRLVVAHAQRRTVAVIHRRRGTRKLVELDGQPLEVAVSPDGRLAAVTTAFWERPGLSLIDLERGRVVRKLNVGPAPFAPMFTPTGDRLLVSGGEQHGTAHLVDPLRGKVLTARKIGRVPRGIAVDGSTAWIALAGERAIVKLSLESGRVEKKLRVNAFPDRVAISPNGRKLLVAHGGRRPDHLSELDLVTGEVRPLRVPGQASAVGWTPRGSRLVALGAGSEILTIDRTGRRRHLKVGPAPRGLAVARGRAFTVSALTGAISEVRA